ncbi:hypothetical protein D9757_002187 [Collybiopsis confluens]|uniref:HTH CENPB-type domain-containing protein n=1 Tax=Collybiopsis confluens TaxID=2823264 RepID=A0A8H5HZR4_9AGAR|nr:hypothetical protein D9757_002187 [Collybiopsis confluens]
MVGRAHSEREKKRLLSALKEEYLLRAITLYKNAQSTPYTLSLRKVCRLAEEQCLQEKKKRVALSNSALHRRLHGGQCHREVKEGQRWLNNNEEEVLTNEVIYWGDRGFPLDHGRLKEHADEIARARHGDAFPATGVGKAWTSRFVSDHRDQIGMYWTHSMDHSRARAVNPFNNPDYGGLGWVL